MFLPAQDCQPSNMSGALPFQATDLRVEILHPDGLGHVAVHAGHLHVHHDQVKRLPF